MDIAWDFSEHIFRTSFEDLGMETIHTTKRFIMDTLGVAMAGSSAEGVKEVIDQLGQWGGSPQSKIIGLGKKVPDINAVFANSIMIHARDFDDTHDGAVVHANVTVLPIVMALSEEIGGIDGASFLTAVALGNDLTCRLGLAIGKASGFSQRETGWVRTAVCGIFGATASACKIFGMEKEKIVDAFGIALSQIGGTRQVVTDSALSKRMQPAFMARAAILSAHLARRGIRGCQDVFEGSYGYFNLYWGGEYSKQELIEDIGKRFEGDNLSFKPYPCCRYTHGPIDATLKCIKKNHLASEMIEEITVRLVKHNFFNLVSRPFALRGNPSVDAQFSIPYTVASAILDGYVFLDSFEPQKVKERAHHPLIKKVAVLKEDPIKDPESLGPVTVDIRTKSGKVFSETAKEFKGHPKNTMDEEECREKFIRCSGYSSKPYSKEALQSIIESVLRLEELKNTNDLIALL